MRKAGTSAGPAARAEPFDLARFFGVFQYSRRAVELVWTTSRGLTVALAILTLIAGTLPAGVAFVGAKIVDGVITAVRIHAATGATEYLPVLRWVIFEALIVAAIAGAQRGLSTCQSLLRAQLANRVNVMIFDKLTRARWESSSRPLSLVMRIFGLVHNGVSLASFGILLSHFPPWAVVI